MITVKEIMKIVLDVSKYEQDIDDKIFDHYKNTKRNFTWSIDSNVSQHAVDKLISIYSKGGWIVKQMKGCDDRPCASPYNYLEFQLPE